MEANLMGLFDLFSNDSANRARDQANAGAQQGYSDLSSLYGQGRDALSSNYGNAQGLYTNLLSSYQPGANAYGDASGANGAAGYDRARSNFQTNPGYQFQLDQGLQALNRTHAAAGNLSSGNADTDAIKYGQGLANQSYGSYLAGLSPYLQGQNSATQGAAGLYAGLGQGLNTSYQGQGGAANTTATTIGNNNAGAELNNYKVGANIFNGIMGAGNWLSGGGPQNVANGAKSLFSAFG
jgi:hypothetical protein